MSKVNEGKLQFIRVIDRITDARKLTWKVVGKFVKRMIGAQTMCETDDLEIIIENPYPRVHSNSGCLTKVVNDLTVMNFIKGLKIQDGAYWANVEMVIDLVEIKFDCIFYENSYPCVFASDQLTLTSSGISVSNLYHAVDMHNMTKGIGLTQRLTDLNAKKEFLVMQYVNLPENIVDRLNNVLVMRRQKEALNMGFTVYGQTVLFMEQNGSMCPICLEKDRYNTVLACNHCFCVDCLSSHMERVGDSHSKCPLCRRFITLKLHE